MSEDLVPSPLEVDSADRELRRAWSIGLALRVSSWSGPVGF
jgi:hypothetical protein